MSVKITVTFSDDQATRIDDASRNEGRTSFIRRHVLAAIDKSPPTAGLRRQVADLRKELQELHARVFREPGIAPDAESESDQGGES